ncbi:hypothetical protein KKB43_07275 [Patescibacteria group bacterium]|nr:hypothetical protein [Patescibacteria group bacterium]
MNITVLVLAILLVLAVGYIAYGFYSDARLQEQMQIYQSGAQVGYEQAVSQLYEQAKSCQQVPVIYNNETINIVAVECLQQ